MTKQSYQRPNRDEAGQVSEDMLAAFNRGSTEASPSAPQAATPVSRRRGRSADDRQSAAVEQMRRQIEELEAEKKELLLQRTDVASAIEVYDNGIALGDRFLISPTGLEVADNITRDEWVAFAEIINRFETSIQWIIGDWLLCGDNRKYMTWEQVAKHFFDGRYSFETLKKYARVARDFAPGIRIPDASFAHHQTVMDCCSSEEEYVRWLELAVDQKWSVSQLRREIKQEDLPGKEPAWVRAIDNVERKYSKGEWKRMSSTNRRIAR
ncbi:MAG: hypothetical protein AAGK74_06160, partial [Chloroflexota bacterium]